MTIDPSSALRVAAVLALGVVTAWASVTSVLFLVIFTGGPRWQWDGVLVSSLAGAGSAVVFLWTATRLLSRLGAVLAAVAWVFCVVVAAVVAG